MFNKKYLYFSRFEINENMGGGYRRFVQLERLLRRAGFDYQFFTSLNQAHAAASILHKVMDGLKSKSSMTDGEYSHWSSGHREYVYNNRLIARRWAALFKGTGEVKTVFIDDPIYFAPLVKKMKGLGISVVAMCQNIETLSAGQVVMDRQRELFNRELDVFSACDMVVTISREETFLLQNLGVDAVYFPYYPVDSIRNRMLGIRKARGSSPKRDIIVMGTYVNTPTRLGTVRIMDAWKRGLCESGDRLLVAGFGMEALKDLEGGGAVVLGTLTNDELDEKLSTIKACLCYQENGSGALTRIEEMLIAGVPVLANSQAARSYYNIRGVVEFSDLDGLGQAIARLDLDEGVVPAPEEPDAEFLFSRLARFL